MFYNVDIIPYVGAFLSQHIAGKVSIFNIKCGLQKHMYGLYIWNQRCQKVIFVIGKRYDELCPSTGGFVEACINDRDFTSPCSG